MRYYFIILITAIAVFLISGSCNRVERYNLKMTIAPEGTINESSDESLTEASAIIRKRLNTFGITDENMTMEVLSDKILMTITGIDSGQVEVLKGIVTTTGELGFWETYENSEVIQYLVEANNKLKGLDLGIDLSPAHAPLSDTLNNLLSSYEQTDTASVAARKKFNSENSLFAILMPRVDNEGKPILSCLIGLAVADDTAKVNAVFNSHDVSLLFPRNIKFLWSRGPYEYDETGKFYELHAIKITTHDGRAPLDGSAVSSSSVYMRSGNIMLRLTMNTEGARIWTRMTRENIDKCIAVVIDGKVISYPRVLNEITGGNTEITGNYTVNEAQYLSNILSSGEKILPLKLRIYDLKTEKME